ncbi:armadillo-type protein [Chytriomyces sp. MP71]|nr:armadillo-type protein [Chytriomyces sp. MP71]
MAADMCPGAAFHCSRGSSSSNFVHGNHDTTMLFPTTQELLSTLGDDAGRTAYIAADGRLEQLRTLLSDSATDRATAAQTAHIVAEVAKSESTRKTLQEAGLFVVLVARLGSCSAAIAANTADAEANNLAVQTLRALANMCYDNEDNRDALLEIDNSIKYVTECLDSNDFNLLKITSGALLNISMDNESVQSRVLECNGAQRMLRAISLATNEETREKYGSLAAHLINTLSNLLEIEKGITDFLSTKPDGLSVLCNVIKTHHSTITRPSVTQDAFIEALECLEPTVTCLEALGENDSVQHIIVKDGHMNTLLDFVDHRPTFALPPLDTDDDEPPSYEDIRKRISRIVTLVTMNDKNMTDIPKHADVMNRFKSWMTLGLHTGKEQEEDEIRMSGALCIGNLARSDKSCSVLMSQYGIALSLLQLLNLEVERVKVGTAVITEGEGGAKAVNEIRSCVKVIHAVVGAFKNLSIAGNAFFVRILLE